MFYKEENIQDEIILSTLTELVPKDHLLRKIDKHIDFRFIYELTKPYYSGNKGRNSIDPVCLFKLVFLKDLYGIKSMRETIKRVETDIAFRWFLGIPFSKQVPHYSTFSQNYIRRFQGTSIFEEIFANILNQAIKNRLIKGTELFTDSTHIKANANKNKYEKVEIEYVQERKEEIEKEINKERATIGKKPFEFTTKTVKKEIKQSKTDPESGYYHRDNKEKGFMYLDNRTVDGKYNLIVDCYIRPGNVHDSKSYVERMEYIQNKYGFGVNSVALDSGYYSKDILKYLEDKNIFGAIAYRRFNKSKDSKYFVYQKENDTHIDTRNGEVYYYVNIDRNGYKQYRSKDKENKKVIRRMINADLYDRARERRLSDYGKELYKKRKETVERSFADSKQNHGYRFAQYRGLAKMQCYTWLSCAAQNMKKIGLILSRWEESKSILAYIFTKYKQKTSVLSFHSLTSFIFSILSTV